MDGPITAAAQRMAVFAGARDSFARAEQALRELCGWHLDDEAIRRLTHAAAGRATRTRSARPAPAEFATTAEDPTPIEVGIDAGKGNTDTGWRDVKVAVFAARKVGEPASLADWDERELPPPTARTVVAGVEEACHFAGRVRAEADRLRVTSATDVTVLGDGAEWIWNLAAEVLPQAGGVLDAYHALAHVSDAVTGIWGDGTGATAERVASGRVALLGGGKVGIEGWIGERFGEWPAGHDGEPLRALAGYLLRHPTRLGYAGRLASGRGIGSGLVEGAIKQVVNRRLKQTGARWRVRHVGPLVELVALLDTPDWNALWTAA